ncbi:MAG: hypothetical protein HQ494_07185 [Rhodospirillales bacterium]|nr:hypothetical protein [Rhodospirillales bacterium]
MIKLIVPALLAAVLAAPTAQAAKMTEKETCFHDVKDAKVNLKKAEDTGKPGEKIEKEAMELFPVAEALCNAGEYEEAAQLTAFLRHLLAD